ncbi:O-antigen ligase family protein [Chloroflexota bacterium]
MDYDVLLVLFEIFIGVVLVIAIFQKPYLGIILIAASLPVADVLPDLPYVSSVTPVIGIITVLSYLISIKRKDIHYKFKFSNIHFISLVFIGWLFISNPNAAWFGEDRNWMLTYIQLWVLLWLAGELLDSSRKQKMLMWFFSIASVISAFSAIIQGQIGYSIYSSLRVDGFATGANTASRYFVISMIFLIYLRSISSSKRERFITTIGIAISIIGLFFTVSRTGILLLFVSLGLMILLQPSLKYRVQVIVLIITIVSVVWIYADNIVRIVESITPSIIYGTDTIGLRYKLWEAGWRMFIAHPIQGVGVGQYGHVLNSGFTVFSLILF